VANELDVGIVSLPVHERELAVTRSTATSSSRSDRRIGAAHAADT
jgi:hypothetical protein